MTRVSEILSSDWVHRLGWTLLHSLWQIAALAAVLAILLAVLRRRTANLRYVTACAGLLVMLVLPAVTYCLVPDRPVAEVTAERVTSPLIAEPSPPPAVPSPAAPSMAEAPPVAVPNVPDRASVPAVDPPMVPLPPPATPLPERVSQTISPWMPWLAVAWFVGVFVLSLWHLGGWIALQRLKHLGTTPAPEPLAHRLAELIERMQLSRPVRMLQSAVVDVAAVVGWLRPVLLVPAAMLAEMSPQQIDAVLAHELAHIRRYDYLVNLLQTVIETLLFYHPAVWWLSRRIRIEREHCCDDAAVAVCGSSLDYAAALMAMEQRRAAPRLAVAAGGADRGGTALSRVRRVLNISGRDPVRPQTWLVGVLTVVTLVGLLAGYMATAGEQPQEPDQAAEQGPIKLRLAANQDRQMAVKLKAVGPSEEEARRRWPWAVTGTVTDAQGRPLEGVKLRANCGMGTLFATGETLTDKEGKYTLRFGPGMRMRNDDGTWSAGVQAATIFAFKSGYTEKNLCRQGGLLMGDKLPEKGDHWYGQREQVVVRGKPRRLDFVMFPAASLEGELVDEQGKPIADKQISVRGKQMLPSTSVLTQGRTDREGRFRFEGIPANYGWWFSVGDQGRTQPITFPGPGAYRVKLQLAHYAQYNLDVFRITSVTDPQDNEVGDKLIGDDPSARPPVAEELQEKGRSYLREMAAACRGWLGPPPAEVQNYEYRFRLGNDWPKTYRVDNPARAAGAIRQGITYFGTPHALASRPEKVVFRQLEVGQETILLRFLVQDSVKMAAGNGISGKWRGYFSTRLREGMLVLDKRSHRPLRTDVGDLRETFSQYMDLGDGRFVPLAIGIEKGSMNWEWKFRVYRPGLWLLAESRAHDQEGRGELLVTVDQVKVNGQPAVPMVQDGAAPGSEPPAATPGPPAAGTDAAREVESLEAKIREIESLCVPAKGTLRHAVEKRFGKGVPGEGAEAPRKRGDPGSMYWLYEFCENGSLFICYDSESLGEVVSARYLDPHATKDRAKPPAPEEQLRELEPRLKQMQLVLAEYKKRFGEDYRNAWGEAVEGVQVRLRADKTAWIPGEDPTFQVDIHNQGTRERFIAYPQSCKIEVDGQWHTANFDASGEPRSVGLGGRLTYSLSLGDFLSGQTGDPPTGLRRGEHTIRVALSNVGEREERPGYENGVIAFGSRKFEAISNAIQIEIVADEPAAVSGPEDNPLGLDDETLIKLFHVGKTLRAAANECNAFHIKYKRPPRGARELFEDYQQFRQGMIADPFASEAGVLRLKTRRDGSDQWAQVWSVGPDGDWDGGKPIDSADPPFDGDLGAEMRLGRWNFNWLADDTITLHLEGKRLAHYLATKGPRLPGRELQDNDLKWGPETDGLRMAARLSPAKAAYALGEKIELEFHVRNVSDHTITIAGFSWRQDAAPDAFVIENESGERLKVGHSWYSGRTPIQRDTLKPGETAVFKSSALAFLAEGIERPGHPVGHTVMTAPGGHTLQFNLRFPDGGSSGPDGMPRPTDWQGVLATAPVTIYVGEPPKFALFRVLGHRSALPFGGKEKGPRRKILFSGVSDEGDGSRRFDSMRPEYYPLEGLILDKTPLLTEADLVGYDWPKHEVHLKPGVRQRLLRGIKPSVWGVPFAVVADGEPVYLGAFWTGASSYSANMPTISVDPWQWTLPKTEPNQLPENAIRIENNQVLKTGEKPRDPRANPRLRQALSRAGKLIDLRPGAGPKRDQPGENEIPAESAAGGEETPWGNAVEGVQCRLRPDKHVWRKGEDPTFKVDLRNRGVREMKTSLIASLTVEVDGDVFTPRAWHRLGSIAVKSFGPGAEYTIEFPLSEFGSEGKRAEDLSPGKHTVRAVLLDNQVGEGGIYTSLDKYKEMALAFSNPVEIEIVATSTAGEPGPVSVAPLRGRVLDHQGKPVQSAKLFLGGGKLPSVGFYDGSRSTKTFTDKDGRFVIDDPDTRATHVLVAAPSLYVWQAPLPQGSRELEIRLPQPAALKIRYDIQGADQQGQFRLELMAWKMEGWKGLLESVQNPAVPNKGEIVLTGLTPGRYDLARIRHLRGSNVGCDAFCDRRLGLELSAGQTAVVDFVRPTGHPLAGQVVGLPRGRLGGAFVYVQDPQVTGDPKRLDEWMPTTFDGAVTDAQGRFTTARVPPGTYNVIARSYDAPESSRRGGLGWQLPNFVGAARVTVPAQGQPPEVRIEMKTHAEFQAELKARQAEWGPAAEGVQVRLRCDRPRWQVDETITWKIDARNTGQRHLKFTPHAYETVKIDVDALAIDIFGKFATIRG